MRVVHIATADCRGGAARAAFRLHEGLLSRGVDSAMLVKSKTSGLRSVQSISRDKTTDFFWKLLQTHSIDNNRSSLSNTFFSIGQPGYDLSEHPLVRKADILHLHWVAKFQSAASIARLQALGKLFIWTLHDQRPFTGGCHFSAGCARYEDRCQSCPQLKEDLCGLARANLADQMQLWRAADMVVVCPSKWLAACARKSALFRNARVETIPYGVEAAVFQPTPKAEARRKLRLSEKGVYLLFGADHAAERRKGFRELIEAIEFCRSVPAFRERVQRSELALLAFGAEHADVASLGIPFISLGYIQSDVQLALAYSAADLFVLPSLEDNLPNTMLEAMSCGTPVAGFDSGGVPDLLTNDITGQLAPVGNAQKLGEAIVSLLSDPSKLEVMGQNCRRTIEQRCSVQRQAEVLHQLYDELWRSRTVKESRLFSSTGWSGEIGPQFQGIFPQLLLTALGQLKKVDSNATLTEIERRRRLRCVRRLERMAPTAEPKQIIGSRWMERLRIELHLDAKTAPSALRRLTRLVKSLGT